jgi:GNAT superfamily N-acetyltransferase
MAVAVAGAVLREAWVADLPACAEIVNELIDETPWLPRIKSREEIGAMSGPDLLSRRLVLVAEVGGRIAAYLSMTPEGLIPALFLVPGQRGLGLGKQLLDEAKARRPGGLRLTVFEPNHAALRFYAREGLTEDPAAREDTTAEGVPIRLCRRGGR